MSSGNGDNKQQTNIQAPPAAGGKSIALMQARLLGSNSGANTQSTSSNTNNQQQQQPRMSMESSMQQSNPAVGSAPPANTNMSAVPSKPKGKDFAAMVLNTKAPSPMAAPAPSRQVPQMSSLPPSTDHHRQQQPQPQQQPMGRPKGKDFAAMAAKSSTPPASAPIPPKSSSITMPPSLPTPSTSSTSSGYNKTPIPTITPQPQRPPTFKQSQPIRTSSHPQTQPPTSLESQLPLTAPITGPKLSSILQSIDPNYTLDDDVQHQILHLVNDFLEVTTMQALKLSNHRGSNVLDVKDVQLVLKKMWGINVPGFDMVDGKDATK